MNSRTVVTKLFACLLPLALLASCASGPYAQKEDKVLRLVSLINEGRVTEVEGLTQTPFALDTETLYLESDVATFWKNLKAASFAMSNASFVSTQQVGEDTWKVFANSYDMKNFFGKYTSKDTSIVTLKTDEGTYYLLLERAVKGYPRIRGMKGPIQ